MKKKTKKEVKSKKKEEGFFKEKYESSVGLVKRSRNYIFAMIFFFVFAALIGFIFPELFYDEVMAAINNIISSLEGKTTSELMVHIFFNNLRASFFALMLGVVFGIFPLITAILNGYIIGFVSVFSVSEKGIFILWRLLPHGVFEIPAIILSMGIGLYLGSKFIESHFSIKSDVQKIILIFLISLVVLPLFVIYYFSGVNLSSVSFENISFFEPLIFLQLVYNFLFSIFLLGVFIYVVYCFYSDKKLKKELVDSLWFFIFVVIPLLFLAAIIEGLLIGFIG